MAKLQQMLHIGCHDETKPFFAAIERQFNTSLDKQPQQQQRYQQVSHFIKRRWRKNYPTEVTGADFIL